MLHIKSAIERGVAVYIITKTLEERNGGKQFTAKVIEDKLYSLGAFVIHKKGMHEKLFFIDDDITQEYRVLAHQESVSLSVNLASSIDKSTSFKDISLNFR